MRTKSRNPTANHRTSVSNCIGRTYIAVTGAGSRVSKANLGRSSWLKVFRPIAFPIARCFNFTTSGDGTVRIVFRIVMATVTFLVFFYSTTIAMSLMYALDSALLSF